MKAKPKFNTGGKSPVNPILRRSNTVFRSSKTVLATIVIATSLSVAACKSNNKADSSEAVAKVGCHWATEQCRDLLDNHVRGIHFYTLNKSDATRRIYENLGARDSGDLRGPC